MADTTILHLTFTNGTLTVRSATTVTLTRETLPLEPDYPYACTSAGTNADITASAAMLVSMQVLSEADVSNLDLDFPPSMQLAWRKTREVSAAGA